MFLKVQILMKILLEDSEYNIPRINLNMEKLKITYYRYPFSEVKVLYKATLFLVQY